MTPTQPPIQIAVSALSAHLAEAAHGLADSLDLPLAQPDDKDYGFLLALNPIDEAPGYRLELRRNGPATPGPVFAEFVGGALGHRLRYGGGRGQPLARAVGLKAGMNPDVLDATAGLGRDAFVLASLGCRVRLVERSPIVATLLENGLQRAGADPDIAPIVQRMRLLRGNAAELLPALAAERRPDVIYLDPMYPQRTKSALVKKEMRAFHALVGADEDAPALLKAALACARRRVVVKRPRLAPALAGPVPSTAILSKNTRYDVYVVQVAATG